MKRKEITRSQVCTRCKALKPRSQYRDRPWPSGFISKMSQCNTCRNQLVMNWRHGKGKQRWREYVRERMEKPGVRDQAYYNRRKWGRTNREKLRDANFFKKYRLRVEQVEEMKKAQKYKCAICKSDRYPLNVDHDHRTGVVREMLCTPCNYGLGQLDDNISRLRSAIAYLQKHSFREVLNGG